MPLTIPCATSTVTIGTVQTHNSYMPKMICIRPLLSSPYTILKMNFSCLTGRIESHVVVEKNFDDEEELIKHSQIE
jgi:hypothetical protein